ncbi:MAG TPA: surface-adhesin E family protein [Gallionella sp.]|nr:surface-adhesin E family protein [Gallionella sp.]
MRAVSILPFLLSLSTCPAFAADQFQSEQAAQQHCPDDTVLWLNLRSGMIHSKGQPWYGKTQAGAYVCKKDLPGKKSETRASEEKTGWRKVVEDDTRTVYASSSPLEKIGDKVTILAMVDLRKPKALSDGKEFRSWETQYEFDCRKRQSRIVAASMYSGNMGGGEVTGSIVYESPEWGAIPKGSNGEALWKLACGKVG